MYISYVNLNNLRLQILANDIAVIRISRTDTCMQAPENTISREAAKQLQEYFLGTRTTFTFPFELSGTAFQKKVWQALQTIHYGQTVSYQQVAEVIGQPKAFRAVGRAIGQNPVLIAVPCHRVIGKNGKLTGFSAGLDLKKQLLDIESKK